MAKNTREATAPVKPDKPETTRKALKPRTVKTVRVDPDAWEAFVRYARRCQGKGDVVEVGELVEVAVRELQKRHPA
jgi:hypothetical protein